MRSAKPTRLTLTDGPVWMNVERSSTSTYRVGRSPTKLLGKLIRKPFTRGACIEPPWEEERSSSLVTTNLLSACIFLLPIRYTDRKSTRLNSSHLVISYAV